MMKNLQPISSFAILCLCLLTACAKTSIQTHYQKPKHGNITIIPYHVNLYWIDYLKNNPPNKHCAEWLKLYLSNLNYPDVNKLTGTIYDYNLDSSGNWVHSEYYDSADSYAASFLILLRDFIYKGGSIELVSEDLAKIKDIGWVILVLQNPDGTVKAKPDVEICYLMNNSEDLAGLYAYLDLSEVLPLGKKEQFLTATLNLQKAMNTLWLDGKQFYWAVSPDESWQSNPKITYPDRLAQLYPIAYGLLNQQPIMKQQLWQQFSLPEQEIRNILSKEQILIYNWAKEAVK